MNGGLEMKIKAQRGEDKIIFIVELDGNYYLVNIEQETCSNPAITPAVFTRFGYFEKVSESELEPSTISEVQRVFLTGTRPDLNTY